MGSNEYYNDEYNKLLDIDESGGSGWYKEFIVSHANDLTILDVGCGPGSRTEFLVKSNNKVVGLELNKKNIKKAKKRCLEVLQFDAEKTFPFKDESFDIIICSQVLEHLLEPKKALHEICRVLKNKGYFFVDVPNHYGLKARIAILFGNDIYYDHRYYFKGEPFDQWNYPHIRFFTYSGFKDVIEENGLSVIEDHSYKTDFFKFTRILTALTHPYNHNIKSIQSLIIKVVCRILISVKFSSIFNSKIYRPSLFSECFYFICRKTGDDEI